MGMALHLELTINSNASLLISLSYQNLLKRSTAVSTPSCCCDKAVNTSQVSPHSDVTKGHAIPQALCNLLCLIPS